MSLSVNDLYNSLGSTSTLSSAALKSTASVDKPDQRRRHR